MDDRTVLALKDDIQKNRQKIELLEKKVKELEEEEERVLIVHIFLSGFLVFLSFSGNIPFFV